MGIPVWVQRTRTMSTEVVDEALPGQTSAAASGSLSSETLPADNKQPTPAHIGTLIPEQPVPDCSTLDSQALQTLVNDCKRCVLHSSRKQPIFATGSLSASYLVISDAPSFDEDRHSYALAGKAGVLLNNMLSAINLSTDNTCVTHTVKCRPPNDRMPQTDEQTACLVYLNRQIELLKPKAILILGRSAAEHLLQQKSSLSAFRSKQHTYADTDIPVIITYHPRNLLRQPADKRKAWEDLKQFRALIE